MRTRAHPVWGTILFLLGFMWVDTATLIAMLEDFATEFDEKLTAEEHSAGIPQESRKNLTNGAATDRA